MNKLKNLTLAALLLFTVNAALAQDKYEYATISYFTANKEIIISTNSETKKIIIPKEEILEVWDSQAAVKQVNKMVNDGWELFDTAISGATGSNYPLFLFTLRKKVS